MNNSNAVLVGRVSKPLETKEVEVSGQKKTVGTMTIAVPKRVKEADGSYTEAITYYDVNTWSGKQQEYLGKLRAGESVLVQGQLSAESYEKDGNKGLRLRVSDAEVTPLGQNNVGKQNIVATGRLTSDVELRAAGEQHTVARIPVAINHGNDKTTFLDVEVWDKQAELMADSLHKGSLINISGDLELNKFERADGTKGAGLKIVNASIGFLDKKTEAAKPAAGAAKTESRGK